MPARLTAAVIGCGRMGAFTSEAVRRSAPPSWLPLSHCEAIVAHEELVLAAACDVDAELLERARARYEIPRVFARFEALLDELKPDLLKVATRTPQRASIIEHAVGSGVCGLHLEKPLCNGVAELLRLEQLLAPESIACTYGTIRRYLPVYAAARDLARSGRYGRLLEVHACFGNAPLLWTHPHSLDMLMFMAGDVDVERVSARFESDGVVANGARLDCDPRLKSVLVEFSNGITGVLTQTGGCDVVLVCSGGTITVESDGWAIRCRGPSGDDPYWTTITDVQPPAGPGGTLAALRRVVTALRGGSREQSNVDKHAILRGQRLMLACAQSGLESGRAVAPTDLDPELWVSGRSGDRYA
jgi:scyllo-inositol 2-dehydrogenase (NAD+)